MVERRRERIDAASRDRVERRFISDNSTSAAGTRTEPAVSVPSAKGTTQQTTVVSEALVPLGQVAQDLWGSAHRGFCR
jgi:hypothetical protein